MSDQFGTMNGMSIPGMGDSFISNNNNNGQDQVQDPTGNINLLMDVFLRVTVELGRTKMQLRQVLELQQGSVVELDRLAGDPVDVYVNERLFARGEVIVVDDKFGVRITEIISSHK
jgi:flagellar motor switch protein FliN